MPDTNSCSNAFINSLLACCLPHKICFYNSYISVCDSTKRCDSLLMTLLDVHQCFFPLVWTSNVELIAPARLGCQRDQPYHLGLEIVYSGVRGHLVEYNSHCLMSLDHSQRGIQCLKIFQTWKMPWWGSRTMGAYKDDWCFHCWQWQNNALILSEWS